jgi:amidohydrolase
VNERLLRAVCEQIDRERDAIVAIASALRRRPELGYFEHASAELVQEQLGRLGVPFRSGLARTGVKGRMSGRASRATLAIFGELDALLMPGHPDANDRDVAHACGHHAQVAAMLGAGIGLAPVMDELDGDVVLFAAPAEECIDLERRLALREQGEIEFLVGKAELIRLGELDDVDLAVVTHTGNATTQTELALVGATHNGSLTKRVSFHGRAAHAGDAPWNGVNALKAAMLASTALDAVRTTFPEEDGIRVHEILSEGGGAVSIVPERARIEAMVRARTVEAMRGASATFDRAMRAGAMALGAEVEIETRLAYLPQATDTRLREVAAEAFGWVLGREHVSAAPCHVGASTDMGDLSALMPVVQPRIGGMAGDPHTTEYRVVDPDVAVIGAAKSMAAMAVELLVDGAARAWRIVEQPETPRLSRERYVELRRELDALERWQFAAAADGDAVA